MPAETSTDGIGWRMEAYSPRSPWWGCTPSPAALVLHVCQTCGCRSERRGQCELCRQDDERRAWPCVEA